MVAVGSIIFLLVVLLVLLLLVIGFETVGFKLWEALLIFIGSTLLFFTIDPSVLLYFRGSIGLGIIDLPLGFLAFQHFVSIGPPKNLAIGFDVAGFLIPLVVSIEMILERRSPLTVSIVGIIFIADIS